MTNVKVLERQQHVHLFDSCLIFVAILIYLFMDIASPPWGS